MKAVIILSGGLDSTALMWKLLGDGHQVDAVSFDYGQRHRKELDAATAVVAVARERFHTSVPHDIIDLRALGALLSASGSALVSSTPVPDGHYADESMKRTVVPNRNMIMLAAAAGIAIARKADVVAYGAHAGDHAIYPDCRAVFASAIDVAVRLADWHEVGLVRPFVSMTKRSIGLLALDIGVPIVSTWSCYKGGDLHCGTCGTCVERREALDGFDPTEYQC
jgi:7-cyano-7-deazaguanine synthase